MADEDLLPSPLCSVEEGGAFDLSLLEILVCPLTHTRLVYCASTQELISEKAGLAFPIREGVAILLPEEARKTKT